MASLPGKRQRLRAQGDEAFLRFLDLSAAEANTDSDSDEEESAADRRFINDDDQDDFEPDHSVVAANPLLFPDEPAGLPDDVDELHAIGEALTAKYASPPWLASMNLYPRSTKPRSNMQALRGSTSACLRRRPPPVPTGENQFFLVYTRKNREYDLLLHLFHTSCVASATAVGLGSGLVVVEIRQGEFEWTREHLPAAWKQSKLDWKKLYDGAQVREVLRMSTYKYFCAQLSLFVTQKLNRWERRGPKAISGFEAKSFLRSRCGTSNHISSRVAARWIRFRSGDHAGHLGLLQANPSAYGNEPDEWDEILIIPSLGGGRNDQERLCLFDTKCVNAERRNKRRNKTFVWCERRFTEGGLEIVGLRRVEPMPYDYDVVPRDGELAMFRRAHVNDQLDLPYIGHTGALQPGDLVVLPDDALWGSRAGLIFEIRDIETVRDKVGNVQLSKEGDDPHLINRVCYADSKQFKHTRFPSCASICSHFRVASARGDRVASVSPNQMLGISAMVHEVDGPDVIVEHVFAPGDDLARQAQVQTRIPLRLVFVQFKIGDVVRVIRGRHINKVGFVVAILPAGWIQFYPAEINEGKFVLVDAGQTKVIEMRPAPDPAADHAASQLDFDVEITGNRLVVEADPVRGPAVPDAPVIFVPGTHLAFEQFDPNDYRDYQDAVPWLHDIPVRVVGTHPLKGLYGDVKGYSWTAASPSKITNIFERYEKLVITVALDRADGGNNREQIPYKYLAHRGSGLPLYTTSLVKSLAKAMVFDKIWPPPPMYDILSLRFLVNKPEFVNKRLDPRLLQFAQGKDKFCGLEGYLMPLEQPLTDKEWNKMAKVFVGIGQAIFVPYPLVFPRRTTGDEEFHDHIGTFENSDYNAVGFASVYDWRDFERKWPLGERPPPEAVLEYLRKRDIPVPQDPIKSPSDRPRKRRHLSSDSPMQSLNSRYRIDPKKNDGLDYAFQETVHGAARQKLPAGDCDQCRGDVERKAITPKDFLELVESDFGIATARDKAAKEDAGLDWLARGFTRFDLNSKAEIQRQWMEKIKGELGLEQTVKTLVAAVPVCPAPETANNNQDKSAKEADIVDFLIDSNLARELQQSTAKGTGLALHALQSTTDIRYSLAWEAQTQAVHGTVLLKLYRMERCNQDEFVHLKAADDETFLKFIDADEARKKRFGDWKKPRFAQAMAAKRLTELLMMFGPGVLLDKRFTIQSLASTSPKYGTVVPAFYRALDKDSKTDEEVYTDY
ncbi:KOW domain-containing protein [Mycena chlorophos]|uniref:KOW domain-containing protein n=1 Tax=Mycena chlorophos TaxID=658473 RepID=A0A8H6WFQ4_MYCCL|nr:KOW domain-containing protein [Mycena chlorophos]